MSLPCHTGTSPKTAIGRSLPSMSGITAATTMRTAANDCSSSAPASASSYAPIAPTLDLFGVASSTIAASEGSTARSSATKGRSYRPSLSDRLTPLLISSGLVRGTTPSWIRKRSGVAIRGSALWPLGGDCSSDAPPVACASLSATRPAKDTDHVG